MIKDFIKNTLKISQDFNEVDFGVYEYTLKDSNEYGKLFQIFENNTGLEQLTEESVVNSLTSILKYISTEYPFEFSLTADFDGDVYTLRAVETEND